MPTQQLEVGPPSHLHLANVTLLSSDRFTVCSVEFELNFFNASNIPIAWGLRFDDSHLIEFEMTSPSGIKTITKDGVGVTELGSAVLLLPNPAFYHNYTIVRTINKVEFYIDTWGPYTHTIVVPLDEMNLFLDTYMNSDGSALDIDSVKVGTAWGGYVATATSTTTTTMLVTSRSTMWTTVNATQTSTSTIPGTTTSTRTNTQTVSTSVTSTGTAHVTSIVGTTFQTVTRTSVSWTHITSTTASYRTITSSTTIASSETIRITVTDRVGTTVTSFAHETFTHTVEASNTAAAQTSGSGSSYAFFGRQLDPMVLGVGALATFAVLAYAFRGRLGGPFARRTGTPQETEAAAGNYGQTNMPPSPPPTSGSLAIVPNVPFLEKPFSHSSPQIASGKVCLACGKPLAKDAEKCKRCGRPVQLSEQVSDVEGEERIQSLEGIISDLL